MKRYGFFSLLIALTACTKSTPLPVYGATSDFELTAQTGEKFSREALDGKIWVADFIFTSCAGPCPRMSSQMRQVQSLVARIPDVRLVSFTVDPERDTPEVLAEYAKRYRAEPGRWHFLTGDRETLHRLKLDTFKLGSVDGNLNHSTRFVLVDRRGRIRGYYGTMEDGFIPQLVRDIRALAREG
ncbi:MAG: SCO family protein [Bryobacteraceae bacterium]